MDTFQAGGCHLVLEHHHCSGKERTDRKMIGFSWLQLMRPDGTVIRCTQGKYLDPTRKYCVRDGEHEVGVYRAEGGLPDHAAYLHDTAAVQRSAKEAVVVRTQVRAGQILSGYNVTYHYVPQLASTRLTQNVELMSLLDWRQHSPDTIPTILAALMKIGAELAVL